MSTEVELGHDGFPSAQAEDWLISESLASMCSIIVIAIDNSLYFIMTSKITDWTSVPRYTMDLIHTAKQYETVADYFWAGRAYGVKHFSLVVRKSLRYSERASKNQRKISGRGFSRPKSQPIHTETWEYRYT